MSSVALVVSVHDVGPPTASATRNWARLMAPLGVPLTFLVVPGPWRGAAFGDPGDDGSDLAGWLRERQQHGDEISVHGWCHHADLPGGALRRWSGSVVARDAGEFWALDRETAARRTVAGRDVLDRHGLAVRGATPPGWLAGAEARRGMADAGLDYLTDHAGLVHLPSGRRWHAPALCHRPATRRPDRPNGAVLGPLPRAAETVGRHVVASAARLVRAGIPVRVALHPADLDRPGLAAATVTAVRRCLEAGSVATTYAQVARRLRGSR